MIPTIPEEQLRAFWTQYNDVSLLVAERYMDRFIEGVTQPIMHDGKILSVEEIRAAQDGDEFWTGWRSYYRPYEVQNSILRIPVQGSLVDKSTMQFGRWQTGHEYIRRATQRGMTDKSVRGILYDIDSPGGDAAGNFELSEEIAGYRGTKPMMAVANGLALSGAYSFATAADELVVTRSGLTGSVGVVTSHVDMSKLLEDWGINISLIFAGKHKVDGHPFGPLPDDVRADIQTRVDKIYGVFTETVARNRSMGKDDVCETEARVYDAADSVSVGFADRVGEYQTERAHLAQRSESMSGKTEPDPQTEGTGTAPNVDAIRTEAAVTAKQEERARFAAVQGCEEYAGRDALAQHLLSETDMSADQIIGTLKVSPVKEPEKPTADASRNHFNERMSAETGQPVGGLDTGEGHDVTGYADDGRPKASVAILDSHRKTGWRPMAERDTKEIRR